MWLTVRCSKCSGIRKQDSITGATTACESCGDDSELKPTLAHGVPFEYDTTTLGPNEGHVIVRSQEVRRK